MLWILRNAYYGAVEGYTTSARQEIGVYQKRDHHPAWGTLFTEAELLNYFQRHYHQDFNQTDFIQLHRDLHNLYATKEIRKTPYYRLTDALDVVRGTFMLQNIEAALNQYDVVFIEMGSGHYVDMYRALQKMLGKPHYIAADQIPPQNLWQECSLEGLQEKVLVQ